MNGNHQVKFHDGVKLQDNGNRFLGPSFVTVHEYRTRSQLEIAASHANLVETQYFLDSGTFFRGMENPSV